MKYLLDTDACIYLINERPSLGTALVTNNEREFRRVKGLTVENWV